MDLYIRCKALELRSMQYPGLFTEGSDVMPKSKVFGGIVLYSPDSDFLIYTNKLYSYYSTFSCFCPEMELLMAWSELLHMEVEHDALVDDAYVVGTTIEKEKTYLIGQYALQFAYFTRFPEEAMTLRNYTECKHNLLITPSHGFSVAEMRCFKKLAVFLD